MSTKPNRKPSRNRGPRRHTFSVKGQLRGKYGEAGLRELLDRLEAAAKPRRRRRRKTA